MGLPAIKWLNIFKGNLFFYCPLNEHKAENYHLGRDHFDCPSHYVSPLEIHLHGSQIPPCTTWGVCMCFLPPGSSRSNLSSHRWIPYFLENRNRHHPFNRSYRRNCNRLRCPSTSFQGSEKLNYSFMNMKTPIIILAAVGLVADG